MTEQIYEVYKVSDDICLFIVVNDSDGYSIFYQSAIQGTYYGKSMRQYYGWKNLKHKHVDVDTYEEALEYVDQHNEYNDVYIIYDDQIVKYK